MTLKTKYLIGGIIVLTLALFFSGYILGHRRGVNGMEPVVSALTQEIQRQVVVINNQTLYVSSIEQEIESLRKAKADGDLTNKELRKLNLKQVNELTRLKIWIDTILNIPHDGRIDTVIVEGKPKNVINLPFSFEKKDQWLDLKGSFDNKGKLGIGLKMNADLDIWTGIDKTTKLPIAKVTSKNPYLNVLSFSSIKMDTYKPKKFGLGVQVGYGFNISGQVKAQPYLGVGLSYNLIRL